MFDRIVVIPIDDHKNWRFTARLMLADHRTGSEAVEFCGVDIKQNSVGLVFFE